MKKLFCFISVAALALSCSSSDDSSSSSSGNLLVKTIEDYGDGTSLTSNYTYNGTKLVKIVSDDGVVENYTYAGDVITKIEYVEDGDVTARETMTYNGSQQLIGYVFVDIDSDYGSRSTYVWNGDGTVSVASYNGDATSQPDAVGTGILTLTNGEVTAGTTNFSGNYTLTYDNKNNPAKNITGFDKLPFFGTDASGMVSHNILTETSSGGNGSSSTYTYNSDNYPITEADTDDTETISTQFFYN